MIYKIHFSEDEKKDIFLKIINNNYPDLLNIDIKNNFYLDTPGALLHKNLLIKNSNFVEYKNIILLIDFFLNKYSETKNILTLHYASYYIEKFYTDLLSSEKKILSTTLNNYKKILEQINLIKKFNLNEKNSFIWIKDLLQNEAR